MISNSPFGYVLTTSETDNEHPTSEKPLSIEYTIPNSFFESIHSLIKVLYRSSKICSGIILVGYATKPNGNNFNLLIL